MRFTVLVSILLLVAGPALALGPGGGCCKAAKAESAESSEGRCCGMGMGQGAGHGHGKAKGQGRGMGHGHGRGGGACCADQAGGMSHHDTIHALLDRHEAIERTVEEIDGGVETVTVSTDPEVTKMIREHVRDMKQRVESGHGMRWWDPTFAELFKHADKIVMEIEDVDGGVKVREFSEDPDVTLLIRQHAVRGVSEFVERGRDRAHEETPLPEGYGTTAEDPATH